MRVATSGGLRFEAFDPCPQQYPLTGEVQGINPNEPIMRLILRRSPKASPSRIGLDEFMTRFRRLILVLGLIFGFGAWQPFCGPLVLLAVCLP
jgi:hypothetical protein